MTLQHHTARPLLRPHERWPHRGHQRWHRPLPIDGSHPNESYGDRLAREILYITHTGLLQDFNNWKSIHRPQPPTTKEELDHTLQRYFDEGHLQPFEYDITHKLCQVHARFLRCGQHLHGPEVAMSILQKAFAKHFLMPMYPKLLHRTDANTYLFCWGCLQAANGRDHMIHPGPWLNTTKESEDANMTPILDLSLVSNRPWALQSLDEDFDADFVPFVWIPSVDDQAQAYHEATFSHFWDNQQNRWRRTSLTCIDTKANSILQMPTNSKTLPAAFGRTGLVRMETITSSTASPRPTPRPSDKSSSNFQTSRPWSSYPNTLRLAFPFERGPTQRHSTHLRPMGDLPHQCQPSGHRLRPSPFPPFGHKNDLFLKQFWSVVLPSLHHHFICRNPNCKKVVLSHHWATNVKPGKRTQGHYLCPACLTYYRPWAMQDHRGNPLLRPKQCLVVKTKCPPQDLTGLTAQSLVHTDRPDIHYFLYLMEWPEDATDDLLQTLKLQTADLFQAYDQAEDKIAFLHDKIRTQLQEANPFLPMNMRRGWPMSWSLNKWPSWWLLPVAASWFLRSPTTTSSDPNRPPRDNVADEPPSSTSPTDLWVTTAWSQVEMPTSLDRCFFLHGSFLLRSTHDAELVLIPGGEVNPQSSHPDGRIEVESRWWLLFSMPLFFTTNDFAKLVSNLSFT